MGVANFVFRILLLHALCYLTVMTQIPGGENERDPSDPKYYELAQDSLNQYQAQTGQSGLLLLGVTRATVQIIAGSITRLNFNVLSLNPYNVLSCSSKITERVDVRPNTKTIDVNCQ